MKLKIPFSNSILHIGKKAVEKAKRSYGYGIYQNVFGTAQTGGRVGFSALYEIYNSVVDVKQAIRKIQNAVMKAGYSFVNVNDQDAPPDPQEIEIAENIFLSPKYTFTTLKDLWVRDLCVAGNSFWYYQENLNQDPLHLEVVDPRTMAVIANKYGDVVKYKQTGAGQGTVEFDPEEIQHSILDYSTRNPVLGVSPIEAIVMDAKAEIESQKSNYHFFENQGVPAHLILLQDNLELNDKQLKELKEDFNHKYRGAENRFKAGLVPYVKDIKTIALSQKDMQYIQNRQFTTKKVVVAFGVDAFILGYTEKVQRGNADVIYKGFYENTIRPYEILFEHIINDKVFPRFGIKNIKFKVNLSDYDNKKEVAEISRLDVMAGIMTVNEARKQRGLEDNDNELADELLFNGLVLDDLAAETEIAVRSYQNALDKKSKVINNLLEI